jgi:ankyrin repeat protein
MVYWLAAVRWNIKFQTQGGDTALMWAAESGHADCVRALVEAGANKYAKNKVRQ